MNGIIDIRRWTIPSTCDWSPIIKTNNLFCHNQQNQKLLEFKIKLPERTQILWRCAVQPRSCSVADPSGGPTYIAYTAKDASIHRIWHSPQDQTDLSPYQTHVQYVTIKSNHKKAYSLFERFLKKENTKFIISTESDWLTFGFAKG